MPSEPVLRPFVKPVVIQPAANEGGAGCGREAAAPALPCPPIGQLPRKVVHSSVNVGRVLEIEIWAAVMKFGVGRVGLWTSTPGDFRDKEGFVKVTDWKEASARWKSLIGHVSMDWIQWVLVMQRHKDGGIHYHVCFVHREDIRGTLDFAALKKRDYRSANAALRAEWQKWNFKNGVQLKHGFGRVEVLPVYEMEGFGRYLSRYLKREIGTRRKEDAGARLVRYSQTWDKVVHGPFSWADMRALRARVRAAEVAINFYGTEAKMEVELGRAWKWKLRRLLWCSETLYTAALAEIERDLEFYRGFEFILGQVFERADKRALEGAKIAEQNGWLAQLHRELGQKG